MLLKGATDDGCNLLKLSSYPGGNGGITGKCRGSNHKRYGNCMCVPCIHSDFYPRPVLAFGYCRCLHLCVCLSVCPCVNHLLVRAITQDPFKLGSPNLSHRCKRPWLRFLLFLGVNDFDLQGQIKLQSQNLPHFELIHAITHHQLMLQFPNLK